MTGSSFFLRLGLTIVVVGGAILTVQLMLYADYNPAILVLTAGGAGVSFLAAVVFYIWEVR